MTIPAYLSDETIEELRSFYGDKADEDVYLVVRIRPSRHISAVSVASTSKMSVADLLRQIFHPIIFKLKEDERVK